MELSSKIEAILFYKGEPISIKKLAELLEMEKEEIKEAVAVLEQKLLDRGLKLMRKGEEITLATDPTFSDLLNKIRTEELNKELTRPTLETLSVILYKNGATRGEIDWIRGVNSSFILRNLQIRGMVEKVTHPTDSRKYLYKPTFDLLSFMGVSKIEDLPQYAAMKANLDQKDVEMKAEEEVKQ